MTAATSRGFIIDACIGRLPVFPLSRIFFLTVKIDPARFHVKRFVAPCTSRLQTCRLCTAASGIIRKKDQGAEMKNPPEAGRGANQHHGQICSIAALTRSRKKFLSWKYLAWAFVHTAGAALPVARQTRSGPWLGFLRVVMRKGDDPRRQPLGMAVELADLDLGADGGVGDVEPRQRDILVQHGRAHA